MTQDQTADTEPDAENCRASAEVIELLGGGEAGGELFDALLGRVDRPSGRMLDYALDDELDTLHVLHSLLRNLGTLCGSPRSALRWLMHSSSFKALSDPGDPPFIGLAEGNFWAIAVLDDMIKVIVERERLLGTDSVHEIFGFREFL